MAAPRPTSVAARIRRQNGLLAFIGQARVQCKPNANQYGVRLVGRVETIRERFYAISLERKIKHPAVVAITEAAREKLLDRTGNEKHKGAFL